MIAYKVFDQDWKCKGFQYEVGKTYTQSEQPILCKTGFHACTKLIDCFSYKEFNPKNKVARVELKGEFDRSISTCSKAAASEIYIAEELSWTEVLGLVNSGCNNTGCGNSGNWNSGNWNSGCNNAGCGNSGDWNSGGQNSGGQNSGNWNSGNMNSGFFNSTTPETITAFNKPIPRKLWRQADIPKFLNFTVEKGETYKEAFQRAWGTASNEEKLAVQNLPNFDPDIFFEISGIQIK